MRRISSVLLILALVLTLCTACGTTTTANESVAEVTGDLRQVTVALDSYPLADTTFLYMASEQGFFAEEDLDVTFVMPDDPDVPGMVSEGYTYFGLCSQLDVILARSQSKAVKSIGAVLQMPEDLILTKKGNRIYSPSDLIEKTLGYDGTDLQKAMVASMLYGSYRSFMDIDLVNISGMDRGEVLEDGTVDAMIGGSILYDLPKMEEANISPDWLKLENYNIPNYYGEVLIASDALIESEPELVSAFLRACAKGYTAMVNNREEAIRCLIRSRDNENLPFSDSLARTTLYTVLPMMQPEEVTFLDQSDDCWNDVLYWMEKWSLVPAGLTVDELRANF